MESVVMQETLFGGIYKNKNVLITGNTGFKGSWLSLWLKNLGANVFGLSLNDHGENSHYNILNLDYKTCIADIREKKDLMDCFTKAKPDIIFHLAAQSLVRESYLSPFETYETNVLGTLNVLDAALNCKSAKVVINVTTDKVYENTHSAKGYKETDPLGGHDMYSSSKACSEILTESFRKSFLSDEKKYLLASARAGNVIGGGDWAVDRLIPDVVKAAKDKKESIIRNPDSVRPWQHVLEPLSGYLALGQKLLSDEKEFAAAWNFGPQKNDAARVSGILDMMEEKWNTISWKHEKQKENFHEAELLVLDSSKANEQLNWSPVWNLEKSITHTIEWYKDYFEKKAVNSLYDLNAYISDATALKKSWCK